MKKIDLSRHPDLAADEAGKIEASIDSVIHYLLEASHELADFIENSDELQPAEGEDPERFESVREALKAADRNNQYERVQTLAEELAAMSEGHIYKDIVRLQKYFQGELRARQGRQNPPEVRSMGDQVLKSFLVDRGGAELLDEAVQEAASRMASAVNNDGLDSQLEFLTVTCGWSEDEVRQAAMESDKD